jgi:hypothetical protein
VKGSRYRGRDTGYMIVNVMFGINVSYVERSVLAWQLAICEVLTQCHHGTKSATTKHVGGWCSCGNEREVSNDCGVESVCRSTTIATVCVVVKLEIDGRFRGLMGVGLGAASSSGDSVTRITVPRRGSYCYLRGP